MGAAVLLIDVQNALVRAKPFDCEGFIKRCQRLVAMAGERDIPVYYIRHDGGPGDELEKGTPGWELYDGIKPQNGAMLFEKISNSAFYKTFLHSFLQSKKVDTIVLAGMQTEFCVDTTCKSAFDLGYKLRIPRGGTTTFDNKYLPGSETVQYFEENIWQGRFADVLPLDEVFDGI